MIPKRIRASIFFPRRKFADQQRGKDDRKADAHLQRDLFAQQQAGKQHAEHRFQRKQNDCVRSGGHALADVLQAHADECVRIPMRPGLRSLNLSNACALGVYEALRQNNFEGLDEEGRV